MFHLIADAVMLYLLLGFIYYQIAIEVAITDITFVYPDTRPWWFFGGKTIYLAVQNEGSLVTIVGIIGWVFYFAIDILAITLYAFWWLLAKSWYKLFRKPLKAQ